MTQATTTPSEKDHWSAQTYSAAASLVPHLTQKVLLYLDPKLTDRVLDVGCGDGNFTAKFLSSVAEVYGVDASPSFMETATQDYSGPNARFKLVDCRHLERDAEAVSGTWDKVVSNAALHWFLRDPSTRMGTMKACFKALKPGGRFVFEMGGAGNVSEAHAALISALKHQGCSTQQARDADPWFFPSEVWMKKALEDVGFQIEKMELEYRPTKLTSGERCGLEGWIRLMGGSMLETLGDTTKEEAAIKEICEVLETVIGRSEDGSQYLGFVRLRGVAVRPP